MKRIKIFILLMAIAVCQMPATAQTDWIKLLSGTIKAGAAATITDEDLAKAIKQEVAKMDAKNKVAPSNSAYARRLSRLTSGMKSANGIKLNFKVYITKDINAFACPDGSVRVFSALMDELTDDELLGVVGHEIGHVGLRHSKKAWRSALIRSAASDFVGAASTTWSVLSDSYVGSITSAALSAKHSRYHETQADEYAYKFLKKCHKDPTAMIDALKKLQKLSKSSSSKYAAILQAFSSHPDFDERIRHLENMR